MTFDDYRADTRTVTTPYGDFAYLDVGEGPPALFVHGLFMSGYFWAPVIDSVRGQRRCIAYNLPDHGGTTVAADQDLSLDANAAMLEAFCDALGLDAFDLVANDTGGAVAQALAVRVPDRVRTLTLTNCEARDWMPSKLELAHWLRDTIPGLTEVVEVDGGLLFWPWERPDELVPHLRRIWG